MSLLYVFIFLFYSMLVMLGSKMVDMMFMLYFLVVVGIFYMFKMSSMSLNLSSSNQLYPLFSDFFSVLLILLSILVSLFSVLSGFSHIKEHQFIYYNFFMFFIMLMLLLFFSVWNVLTLFLTFEFVLLPMILILVMWGSQSDRLTANYYFFSYTVIGSMPLLLSVIYLQSNGLGFYFYYMVYSGLTVSVGFMLMFIVAFLCKLPVYGLHIWLPKAHVEAPVSGSMVLASLLLKMSGYGILRFFLSVIVGYNFLMFLLLGFFVMGMMYPMFICLRQSDIKALIAYSSVSHMCVALMSLFLYSIYGMKGALVIYIGHGLISPAMFFLGNMIYERLGSRSLLGMGGYDKLVPSLLFYFVCFFIANMSYPPFISFFGELCVYLSVMSNLFSFFIFLFIFILISSVVMFYFLSKILKSSYSKTTNYYMSFRELFVSYGLLFSTIYMTLLFIIM